MFEKGGILNPELGMRYVVSRTVLVRWDMPYGIRAMVPMQLSQAHSGPGRINRWQRYGFQFPGKAAHTGGLPPPYRRGVSHASVRFLRKLKNVY